MKPQHTPGPWEINDEGDICSIGPYSKIVANPNIMAATSETIFEMEANAKLIAAAPELLEALREADKELRFHNWQNSTTGMLISNLVNQFPPC